MNDKIRTLLHSKEYRLSVAVCDALVDISEQIFEIMKKKKISCTELSRRTRIPIETIIEILSGDFDTTIGMLIKIAESLNCSVEIKIKHE